MGRLLYIVRFVVKCKTESQSGSACVYKGVKASRIWYIRTSFRSSVEADTLPRLNSGFFILRYSVRWIKCGGLTMPTTLEHSWRHYCLFTASGCAIFGVDAWAQIRTGFITTISYIHHSDWFQVSYNKMSRGRSILIVPWWLAKPWFHLLQKIFAVSRVPLSTPRLIRYRLECLQQHLENWR